MTYLSPLEASFFAMESPSRPMHAGGVMLFDPPPDGDSAAFVEQVLARFRSTVPVSPWNRRPVLRVGSLPHWETVEQVDLAYHVRRLSLPGPGTLERLMETVSHLYPALLDRSRPLWETYVIDGVEQDRIAVFVKAHHSLADGVGGLKMFFGSLSTAPDDDPRPVWAGRPASTERPRPSGTSGGVSRSLARLARAPLALARVVPDGVRLALGGGAMPFLAARTPSMSARISAARSFAALDLPLAELRRVGRAHGGTVNDVVLAVCDDAMHRYVDESGGAGTGRMIALMPVSTRKEHDTASNSAGAVLVPLGDPSATPQERITQVVASTKQIKSGINRASPLSFQLQTLSMLAAMELREQLPVARGLVPNVSNFTVSNVSGAPSSALYLGRARMRGLYAAPIVAGSTAANITLIPYLDSLCIGIGAARNIVPDTARLADLMQKSLGDLRAHTPRGAATP